MKRSRIRRSFRFSPSARAEAVRLVVEEGVSKNAVAKQFNTGWGVVDCWVRKAQATSNSVSRPMVPEPENTAAVEAFTLPEVSLKASTEPEPKNGNPSNAADAGSASDERLFFQQRIQNLREERDFLRALVSHLVGLAVADSGLDSNCPA